MVHSRLNFVFFFFFSSFFFLRWSVEIREKSFGVESGSTELRDPYQIHSLPLFSFSFFFLFSGYLELL